MFTLVTDRNKFLRIRRGVACGEIEKLFKIPAAGEIFVGKIIEVGAPCEVYTVRPCENYSSIALKTGTDREDLERLNGGKVLYPSCKIFVPLKK